MNFRARDLTFDEEACRVRTGGGTAVHAGRGNAAFTMLDPAGHDNKTAALRRHAPYPDEALA